MMVDSPAAGRFVSDGDGSDIHSTSNHDDDDDDGGGLILDASMINHNNNSSLILSHTQQLSDDDYWTDDDPDAQPQKQQEAWASSINDLQHQEFDSFFEEDEENEEDRFENEEDSYLNGIPRVRNRRTHDTQQKNNMLSSSQARDSGDRNEFPSATVRRRMLELQLAHAHLQLQAMAAREQTLIGERDELLIRAAQNEQDLLLIETKLRDVATFELSQQQQQGSPNGAMSSSTNLLREIRGKLLQAANDKIAAMVEELCTCRAQAAEAIQQREDCQEQWRAENQALHEEVKRLTDQLAQRTVLFSAQERRWRDGTRMHLSLQTEQSRELLTLRGRVQQLERDYERVDRERLDAVMQARQLSGELQTTNARLADEVDRSASLDAELSDLSRANTSLQATVERLRGADVADIERELAAEVEGIRASARDAQQRLERQLLEARERLAQEAALREALADQVQQLNRHLAEAVVQALESGAREDGRRPGGAGGVEWAGVKELGGRQEGMGKDRGQGVVQGQGVGEREGQGQERRREPERGHREDDWDGRDGDDDDNDGEEERDAHGDGLYWRTALEDPNITLSFGATGRGSEGGEGRQHEQAQMQEEMEERKEEQEKEREREPRRHQLGAHGRQREKGRWRDGEVGAVAGRHQAQTQTPWSPLEQERGEMLGREDRMLAEAGSGGGEMSSRYLTGLEAEAETMSVRSSGSAGSSARRRDGQPRLQSPSLSHQPRQRSSPQRSALRPQSWGDASARVSSQGSPSNELVGMSEGQGGENGGHDGEGHGEGDSTASASLVDARALEAEVRRLAQRETDLLQALREQRSKLALVLRRAAMLPGPGPGHFAGSSNNADPGSDQFAGSQPSRFAAGGEWESANAHGIVLLQGRLKEATAACERVRADGEARVAELRDSLASQTASYEADVRLLELQCAQSKQVGELEGLARGKAEGEREWAREREQLLASLEALQQQREREQSLENDWARERAQLLERLEELKGERERSLEWAQEKEGLLASVEELKGERERLREQEQAFVRGREQEREQENAWVREKEQLLSALEELRREYERGREKALESEKVQARWSELAQEKQQLLSAVGNLQRECEHERKQREQLLLTVSDLQGERGREREGAERELALLKADRDRLLMEASDRARGGSNDNEEDRDEHRDDDERLRVAEWQRERAQLLESLEEMQRELSVVKRDEGGAPRRPGWVSDDEGVREAGRREEEGLSEWGREREVLMGLPGVHEVQGVTERERLGGLLEDARLLEAGRLAREGERLAECERERHELVREIQQAKLLKAQWAMEREGLSGLLEEAKLREVEWLRERGDILSQLERARMLEEKGRARESERMLEWAGERKELFGRLGEATSEVARLKHALTEETGRLVVDERAGGGMIVNGQQGQQKQQQQQRQQQQQQQQRLHEQELRTTHEEIVRLKQALREPPVVEKDEGRWGRERAELEHELQQAKAELAQLRRAVEEVLRREQEGQGEEEERQQKQQHQQQQQQQQQQHHQKELDEARAEVSRLTAKMRSMEELWRTQREELRHVQEKRLGEAVAEVERVRGALAEAQRLYLLQKQRQQEQGQGQKETDRENKQQEQVRGCRLEKLEQEKEQDRDGERKPRDKVQAVLLMDLGEARAESDQLRRELDETKGKLTNQEAQEQRREMLVVKLRDARAESDRLRRELDEAKGQLVDQETQERRREMLVVELREARAESDQLRRELDEAKGQLTDEETQERRREMLAVELREAREEVARLMEACQRVMTEQARRGASVNDGEGGRGGMWEGMRKVMGTQTEAVIGVGDGEYGDATEKKVGELELGAAESEKTVEAEIGAVESEEERHALFACVHGLEAAVAGMTLTMSAMREGRMREAEAARVREEEWERERESLLSELDGARGREEEWGTEREQLVARLEELRVREGTWDVEREGFLSQLEEARCRENEGRERGRELEGMVSETAVMKDREEERERARERLLGELGDAKEREGEWRARESERVLEWAREQEELFGRQGEETSEAARLKNALMEATGRLAVDERAGGGSGGGLIAVEQLQQQLSEAWLEMARLKAVLSEVTGLKDERERKRERELELELERERGHERERQRDKERERELERVRSGAHDLDADRYTRFEDVEGRDLAVKDAIEALRQSHEGEKELAVKEAVETLRRSHRGEMRQYRRRLAARCRGLLSRQQLQFHEERSQLVALVQQECRDIILQAEQMAAVNRSSKGRARSRPNPSSSPSSSSPSSSTAAAAAAAAAVASALAGQSPTSQPAATPTPAAAAAAADAEAEAVAIAAVERLSPHQAVQLLLRQIALLGASGPPAQDNGREGREHPVPGPAFPSVSPSSTQPVGRA